MTGSGSTTTICRGASPVTFGLIIIATCCLYDSANFVDSAKIRLCVVESVHTSKKINRICPKLSSEEGNQVECVIANDRLNCLRRLTAGDAEFTVLEPEDLIIAKNSDTEYDILVTHELRLFKNDTQSFAMVALVKSDIESASDLMGKNFCHGGFENSEDSTQIFAKYFQNWIIPRKCDRDKTLVENEISSLANYFGQACIPGAWTSDSSQDNRLKSKYRNLCALCDKPAGCYQHDKYHGREGALLCMTDNSADIAWVRLEDALRHFKVLSIDEKNFSYLCPDGTTRAMGRERPCVWITRPWPVIAASRVNAERVAKIINELSIRKFPWQIDVEELMENYRFSLVPTDNLQTPEDFLRRYPGFTTANSRAGCTPSRTIRWCVGSNLESRKCRSMKQAALAYGIEPPISCIQQQNRTTCIHELKTGRCDIFVVQPEEEAQARLMGTKALVRAITNRKQDINVVATLVKKDSPYQRLEDLKGSLACFTGYRSIGWNAFVDAMANETNNRQWNCSDLQAVSNFFKDSCVFGLEKLNLEDSIPLNLHSLCPRLQGNHDNSNDAAYACLESGIADVAFVNLENGLNNDRGSPLSAGKNLRSICLRSSDEDERTCFLTWSELGTVIINENTTELRSEEIYSTLLEIDVLFGKSHEGQTQTFSLYGSYETSRDVIFPERTQHLQKEVDRLRLPRNYDEIVERFVKRANNADYCSKGNRPTGNWNHLPAVILLVAIIFAGFS